MENTCRKCGEPLGTATKFCMKCGAPIIAEEPAKVPQAEGKERKKSTTGRTIPAVFLCILAFVAGFAANLVFFARSFSAETFGNNLSGKLELGKIDSSIFEQLEIDGIEVTGDSVSEIISNNLMEQGVHVTKEEVDGLLEADFLKEFIDKKSNDYLNDLLYHTGEGVVTEEEVVELLENNRGEIEQLLDIDITDEDIRKTGEYLEDIKLSNVTRASELLKEQDITMGQIQFVLSLPFLAVLLGGCLMLFVLVFFLKGKPLRGMRPVGITVSCIAVTDLAIGLLSGYLPERLNRVFSLGKETYSALLSPLSHMSYLVGAVLLGVGVLFIVVGSILCARANKKS